MASSQPWRYRCPRGHASWTPLQDGYKCDRCRINGVDPYFVELIDMKRETIPKDP